jgi:hypothetical protein
MADYESLIPQKDAGGSDPYAALIPEQKMTETEGGAAIGFPSPLPKREKGFASGVVSGLTGEGGGPSVMQQTPIAKQYRAGQQVGEPLGLAADIAMTAVPAIKGGQAVYGGAKMLGERLALGKTAKSLAEDLRQSGTKRAGQIAKQTGQEMTAAEQRAAIAGKAEEKAGRGGETAFKPLAGVTTEMEAGRFKPIAQTAQDIGTKIKDSANKVMDRLKATRDTNAKTNKQDAFGEAFKKEAAGQTIKETKAYNNALEEIDTMIKNPTTGLSNAPVGEIENQLKKVRGMLDRTIVDVDGTVISRAPASFEGLEDARRFLRDRSFGMPAEGYDAISQQMAGRLADRIEAIQKEFSPSIEEFLKQYEKDSEPLRVFQSNIGKALTDVQLPGGGTNFASVSAKDIPGRVFDSKENYDALIKAFGGDRKLAEAEAKRYFASQLENKKTALDVENFIRDKRSMLRETNSLPMAEKYAIDLRTYEKRTGAAGQVKKSESEIATKKQALVKDYQTFESNLSVAANDPAKITSAAHSLSKSMLEHNHINQTQYRELERQIERVRQTTKDATTLNQQMKLLAYRATGYGLVGGGAAYLTGKTLGGD